MMSKMLRCMFVVLMCIIVVLPAPAAPLALTDKGISVDGGTMGKFTIEYPELQLKDGKTSKIVESKIEGKSAKLTYANGGQLNVALAEGGKVQYQFSAMDDVKSWKSAMFIGVEYSQGGTWKIGEGEAKPFPPNKTPGGHFFQGNNAGTLTLKHYDGKTLSVTPPPFSFGQMTDNREWNWAIFTYIFFAPYDKNNPQATITISDSAASGKAAFLVDEFGQLSTSDWPLKVKSPDELKADVESEKAYYASLQPPPRDKFGGLLGGKEKLNLKATGFFRVEKQNNKWLMVDPEGNPFFHIGLCAFNPVDDYTLVKGRESSYAWLPPYEGDFKTRVSPRRWQQCGVVSSCQSDSQI